MHRPPPSSLTGASHHQPSSSTVVAWWSSESQGGGGGREREVTRSTGSSISRPSLSMSPGTKMKGTGSGPDDVSTGTRSVLPHLAVQHSARGGARRTRGGEGTGSRGGVPPPFFSSTSSSSSVSSGSDPIHRLRECITTFLQHPSVFGTDIAGLLIANYRSVVQRHCELGNEFGMAKRPSTSSQFTGETELLLEVKETRGSLQRVETEQGLLSQQIEILRGQLQDKTEALAGAEKSLRMSEMREVDTRNRLRTAEGKAQLLQHDVIRIREHYARLELESQRDTTTVDDTKIQERTAELRQELARLYDMVRTMEESAKSYEREIGNLKTELEELDSKHSSLLKDHDALVETLGERDVTIAELNSTVQSKDKRIAELQHEVQTKRLELGSSLVQASYIAANPNWRAFKGYLQQEREDLLSRMSDTPATVKKLVKPLGEGPDVQPYLRYAGGKIKPRTIRRNDMLYAILLFMRDHPFDPLATPSTVIMTGSSSSPSAFGMGPGLSHSSGSIALHKTQTGSGREGSVTLSAPSFDSAVVMGKSVAESFRWWLVKFCGDNIKTEVEWATGFQQCLERAVDDDHDPDATLFQKVLDGELPLAAHHYVYRLVQELYEKLVQEDCRLDGEGDPQGTLPVTNLHSIVKAFVARPEVSCYTFLMKEHQRKKKMQENDNIGEVTQGEEEKKKTLESSTGAPPPPDSDKNSTCTSTSTPGQRALPPSPPSAAHNIIPPVLMVTHPDEGILDPLLFALSIDQNTPHIAYKALFEADENGLRSFFMERLLRIVEENVVGYYTQVEAALRSVAQRVVLSDGTETEVVQPNAFLRCWHKLDPGFAGGPSIGTGVDEDQTEHFRSSPSAGGYAHPPQKPTTTTAHPSPPTPPTLESLLDGTAAGCTEELTAFFVALRDFAADPSFAGSGLLELSTLSSSTSRSGFRRKSSVSRNKVGGSGSGSGNSSSEQPRWLVAQALTFLRRSLLSRKGFPLTKVMVMSRKGPAAAAEGGGGGDGPEGGGGGGGGGARGSSSSVVIQPTIPTGGPPPGAGAPTGTGTGSTTVVDWGSIVSETHAMFDLAGIHDLIAQRGLKLRSEAAAGSGFLSKRGSMVIRKNAASSAEGEGLGPDRESDNGNGATHKEPPPHPELTTASTATFDRLQPPPATVRIASVVKVILRSMGRRPGIRLPQPLISNANSASSSSSAAVAAAHTTSNPNPNSTPNARESVVFV